MFIEPKLRAGGSADITRRSAITSIAAGLTGAMLKSPLRGAAEQHLVVGSTPSTQLLMADMYGNPSGSSVGTVLACPQSCAAVRPGYAEAVAKLDLNGVYLNTSEWMREIIYTPDDLFNGGTDQTVADLNWRNYRRQLGFSRVSNDAYTTGCGHVSRNVVLTAVSTTSGKFTELPAGSKGPSGSVLPVGPGYSSLVYDPVLNPTGPLYQAGHIYIFQGDWAPLSNLASTNLNKVVKEIGTDSRPIDVSACPAPKLPYPQ
jgi:hypothetical protein